MMEAVRTSETSVNIYLTTRQYILEDSELDKSCSKKRGVWTGVTNVNLWDMICFF
jgi:hypothetical protein